MSYEQNVETLEAIYIMSDTPNLYPFEAYIVDTVIAALAKAGPEATLYEVAEQNDVEFSYLTSSDSVFLRILAKLHFLWFKPNNIINSSRNYLNIPESNDWKDGYNHELAKFIVSHSKPVVLNESTYGWIDYEFTQEQKMSNPIVAVVKIYEDQWAEFVHTFTGHDLKVGMTAEVIYQNGLNRRIRYEGEIGEIIRSITK
jgi:hypothetical protein